MRKQVEGLTEAEQSVMEVLWSADQKSKFSKEEGATIRELVVSIYGTHEHSLHAGVKSFLDRLLEKGYVSVDKSSFAHRFFAKISREEYASHQLKSIADSHFDGSLMPMLMSLVDHVKLSRKDRAKIEKIIEDLND